MNIIIKNTLVVYILLLSLICISCVKEDDNSNGFTSDEINENNTSSSTTINSISSETDDTHISGNKRILYYTPTLENYYDILSSNVSEDIELKPIDSRFEPTEITTKKLSDVSATSSITLNGKTYTLDYKESSENAFLGYDYDEYSDGTVTFRLSKKDGKLLYFCDNGIIESGTLSKKEALKKGQTIISDLYGDEVQKEYEFENIVSNKKDGISSYTITYVASVWHFYTNIKITIEMDANGNIHLIQAPLLGYTFNAEQFFTEQDANKAMEATSFVFRIGFKEETPQLIIDSSGKYYYQSRVVSSSSDNIEGSLYIEITPDIGQ